MAPYYYSTQPFLAWCLNHYFYNRVHYLWVGKPFYPYKQSNPRSSNPMRLYEELYEPWRENDPYNKNLKQWRLDLRKGVAIQRQNKVISTDDMSDRLKDICDYIDQNFFYPLVYRVDMASIPRVDRDRIAGSAARVDSHEYRVPALGSRAGHQWDYLLVDFADDPAFYADPNQHQDPLDPPRYHHSLIDLRQDMLDLWENQNKSARKDDILYILEQYVRKPGTP